jgi:tetratricopeptide (TPR) repeat protein
MFDRILKINMMKKISILIIILIFTHSSKIISQEASLSISSDYGPYSAGFKSFYKYDKTRSFSIDVNRKTFEDGQTIFRPMQICVWYPTLDNTGSKMKYEDYFLLTLSEIGKIKLTQELKKIAIERYINEEGVDRDILNMELNAPMMAISDANPYDIKKFPVIVYGPSLGSTAFENALLFEFLASHGYIVVSSPSMGPVNREMPVTRESLETQARDMEFLLGFMDTFPNADINKIIVAGFSYGGLSNVFMAARNKSVDAWIGLDPSIHEIYQYFEESAYNDYSNFSLPMLFVNSLGYKDNLPFYNKLIYSDAYIVDLPELQHTDLASQFIKLYGSDSTKVEGYNTMANYILGFLDGVFKKNYEYDKMTSIVFNENDIIDSSFVKIKSKKGLPNVDQLLAENEGILKNKEDLFSFLNSTLSIDGNSIYPENVIQKLIFISTENGLKERANELMRWYQEHYPNSFHKIVLEKIDFNKMMKMFIEIYKINSNECKFTYVELNHTGHILSMGDRKQEAIEYFELNTQLYPENYQAYFNLGIGYFRLKDIQNAIVNFYRCLELNPDERFKSLATDMLEKCKLENQSLINSKLKLANCS